MKQLILSFSLILAMLSFSLSAFANSEIESASEKVKAEVEADYQQHYAASLDSQKDQFNVTGEDSLSTAQLGNGIAYYTIDVKNDKPAITFAGYQFPLLLNGKQIATVQANKSVEDKWEVANISNIVDMEKVIQVANDNKKGTGKIKLIEDKSYGIKSVYIQDNDGERFVDLKSGKSSTVADFNDEIVKKHKDKEKHAENNKDGAIQAGGTPIATNSSSNNTPYIFAALGILFMIPVIYFFLRKRTGRSLL
jgi:hypothetical protein